MSRETRTGKEFLKNVFFQRRFGKRVREKRLKEKKEDGIFYLRHNKITAAWFKNVLFLTCEISLELQKKNFQSKISIQN